ncbi:hypothetical protein D915_000016 [Fasciola hepatica]|uniref:ZP domain-containing protein n=1 Tax=Fasciola hepatica TaxID=6192 RepID=A0A4E0RJA6_FASHE|nr:hypothetical protein D915_000016 [Fasciola hepatica]
MTHPISSHFGNIVQQILFFSVYFFVFLLSVTTQNEHLVYSGACALYDTQFCSRQVENSVCNKVKNECFCKKDFVAIRENGRVTCKTLLTDLKCRVDRDCIHVNRSSCHPGAGYCSCPGNTIYVPQQHACRTRVSYNQDSVCKSCQLQNGSCFLYESFELSDVEKRFNPSRIGCVCPDGKIPVGMQFDGWTKNICSGKLVDMGFECDQKHAVCRSKRAICDSVSTQTSRSFSPHKVPANFLWPNIVDYSSMANGEQGPKRICQCQNTMVAVYQSTLGYTECFPQLGPKAAQCHSCIASGGLCYDLNNDGVGDGCVCPPHKSLGSKLRSTGEQSCTGLQVSLNCSDGHLSVCYRPHSAPPYEHLATDLTEGKAVAQLVPTNAENMAVFHEYMNEEKNATSSDTDARSLQFRDPCQLNKMESNLARLSNQMDGFTGPHSTGLDQSIQEQHCVHFDVWQMKQTCGVRIYRLNVSSFISYVENAVQYEALLEIMVNRTRRTPNKDFQIPLKCISPPPKRMPTLDYHLRKTVKQSADLEFRVVNKENREIYATQIGTTIRLDALLLDSSGQYKVLTVEKCQYGNRSTSHTSDASHKMVPFIYKGCPLTNAKVQIPFTNGQYPSDHVQSAPFPAFREGTLFSLFFKCVFQLCVDPQQCFQASPSCDSGHAQDSDHVTATDPKSDTRTWMNGSTSSSVLLVERWTHVEVTADLETDNSITGFQKIPSTVRDYPVDYALRQFNFPTDPSSSSNPKYPPCHFTLCLNTTHLAWISIALLTVIMLFVLVLLFLYKRKRYIEGVENPINAKKQTMQHRRQRARSQAVNYEECSKIISNRTYVPKVSLETGSDRQTQSVLRVPPCLLGTTPTRTTEPFVFEQQSVRESGIMSPVFYGSDSSCPERPGSQLFRYRDSTGRSTAGITAAMSSEGLMVNSNIPCKARIGHSEAYCYCDQLSRRTMELGSDRNQTMPLERRARRLQHIVNFTRAQRTSEFDQIDEEAMITTGWQPTGTNTDLISCGYSSSEDRKQLLQTLPHQTRRSGQEGYLNEHNDSVAQTIQPLSTDLIVLNNNCTDSSEPNSKRTSYAECTKGNNQQMHM